MLQVTASQATNATANQASKYIAADMPADQAAFNHGHATVSSAMSGDKVAGSKVLEHGIRRWLSQVDQVMKSIAA